MANKVRRVPMKTGTAKSHIQSKFAKAKENTPSKSRSNSKNRKANNFVKIWVPKGKKPVSTAISNSTTNRNSTADSNTTADQVSTAISNSTANRNSVADSNTTANQVSTANKDSTATSVNTVKPIIMTKYSIHEIPNSDLLIKTKFSEHEYGNQQLKRKSIWHVDSGCSRHMTGNMDCLQIFKRFDGGRVAFGDNPVGGKISGKGMVSKGKMTFEDVYNVEKLRYNLLSVSQDSSAPRTPQQNGVAERRNRTLIEAARSLLADSKLPITFWAEAVNTACYVQNRFLVVKSQGKTPYELFKKKKPFIGFFKPFGCPCTILNTKSHLGKFESKAGDGFLVGYSSQSKAYRVFNSSSRIIEESDNVKCNENTPNQIGTGLDWLSDIDSLTNSLGFSNVQIAGTSSEKVQAQRQEFVLFPIPAVDPIECCQQEKKDDSETEDSEPEQDEDDQGDEENKDEKEDAPPSGSGNTGSYMPNLSEGDTDDENSSVFGGNSPEKNDSVGSEYAKDGYYC
ncbi:hypothetical protein L6452_32559 [Arctium lappa]|uniref:Uncharacterized protein n=1 Tax=Arctium lappa TaxID=4217 RepID=A0ACB8Z408_ARCLA|nr:hypothetical protein L6452_32559 [Arctium lappa]